MWKKVLLRGSLLSVAAMLLGVAAVVGGGAGDAAQATVRPMGVDDFDYGSWDSEYVVSLDERGRSVVYVKETMVALFPDFDQNRGIVRSVPAELNEVKLRTKVLAISDEHGNPVHYKTKKEDGWIYLLLGTDEYLHGPHTFVIEYEMRDALVSVKERGIDEFYWNILPLFSTQDIGSFHASVSFSPELVAAQTGDWACYEGRFGSTEQCGEDLVSVADGNFEFSSGHREAGDGVTLAVGINSGTVKQPIVRSNPELFWGGSLVGLVLGLISSIAAIISQRLMVVRSRKGKGVVIAQYDVPANLSPLVAAELMPRPKKPFAAQILHLAVNGVLTISEVKRWGGPTLKKVSDAKPLGSFDVKAASSLFNGENVLKVPSRSTAFASRMTKLQKAAEEEAEKLGFTKKKTGPVSKVFFYIALGLFAVSVLVSVAAFILGSIDGFMMIVVFAVGGILILSFASSSIMRRVVLTAAGAKAYEHLRGVKMFIGVAEADRMRMLQSVSGVKSEAEAANSENATVAPLNIYEKLLPYAVLFGQEKSWGKVLEKTYRAAGVAPVWMIGDTVRPFSSQVNLLASSAQSSAGYGTSTSSGGGSGGGGFSGGGGGGGFSGGR